MVALLQRKIELAQAVVRLEMSPADLYAQLHDKGARPAQPAKRMAWPDEMEDAALTRQHACPRWDACEAKYAPVYAHVLQGGNEHWGAKDAPDVRIRLRCQACGNEWVDGS